jgi:transposase
MVTKYMFEKIRKKKLEGKNSSEIARELGIDRRTVGRYSASNAPPSYKPRGGSTRVDPCMGFEAKIASMLELSPSIGAYDVLVRLRPLGFLGSQRTLSRRLAELRSLEPKERFFEQSYEPAEQSQVDFKESVELSFSGGKRVVNFLIGTLPYSGAFWAKGFPVKSYEAFMDGVHTFFENVGGMTTNLRFDNLSPCVRQVCSGQKRLYTESFQRATDYYGFGLLPCSPGKGNEKGDVERQIRTFAHRIKIEIEQTGRIFSGFDDLNEWLGEICLRERSEKIVALLTEEQKKLSSKSSLSPTFQSNC